MKILILHRGGISGTGGATYAGQVVAAMGSRHGAKVMSSAVDLDGDCDVVHALDMKHFDPAVAARVRAPLVVDVHDAHWVPGEPFYPTPDWPLRAAFAFSRRRRYYPILKKAAMIVVHSEYVKNRLGDPKARVVPYAVEDFAPGQSHSSRPPEILFAGRDYFRKGLPVLLKAWRIVKSRRPDAKLFIAGREFIHGELYAKIFARDDSITLLAGVERNDLLDRMRRARAVVLPSYIESFGITLIEAMRAGAIAIGSSCGGIPEALRNGDAGILFPTGDHRALADAILSSLDDSPRNDALVAKGKSVAAEHSVEAMIAALEKIYSEVVAR